MSNPYGVPEPDFDLAPPPQFAFGPTVLTAPPPPTDPSPAAPPRPRTAVVTEAPAPSAAPRREREPDLELEAEPAEAAAPPAPAPVAAPLVAAALDTLPAPSGQAARRRGATGRHRLLAAGVIAVGLTAVLVPLGLRLHHAPAAPVVAAPAGRSQRTVLLAVTGYDGNALAQVVLAHDPATGRGALVLVPGRVLAEVPGKGTAPVAEAAALPGADLPRQAVADLLGVTVDSSLVLSVKGVAAIVDRVGGIEVTVDAPVLAAQPDGSSVVAVPVGRQRLGGLQVERLLIDRPTGQDELQLLPRVQAVVDGLLAALPTDPTQRDALFADVTRVLASTAHPVADPRTVEAVLAGVAADSRARAVTADTLPVLRVDIGGTETAYRMDAAGIRRLVDSRLAASVPPGVRQGDNRVLVLNGVGTPGVGETVRNRIVPAGFVFLDSRNAVTDTGAARFDYQASEVVVFDTDPATVERGKRLAQALGLPASAVRVSTRSQSVADLVVVVGADFHG